MAGDFPKHRCNVSVNTRQDKYKTHAHLDFSYSNYSKGKKKKIP